MNRESLGTILKGLTVQQKIGQLVQVLPYFLADIDPELITGPLHQAGLDKMDIFNSGSTLNIFNPDDIRKLHENYTKRAGHGVPLLICADIIYGFRTIFPIPLAQVCSFDFAAIENAASISAAEMSSSGVHCTFSPMLDLTRDPRWGRVLESPGEDVLLCSLFAEHVTRGLQGDVGKTGAIPNNKVAACVKHFAAYGAPEGGREYAPADMSMQKLYGEYLPAYKSAVEAGARMVMTSFNTLNGVPATGNVWLNRTVLRKQLGFKGVLISDFAAIFELIAHGYAEDKRDAARLGMLAGVDIDMMTPCYANELEGLLESGVLDAGLLDEAVMRVLELKNDLGLFEDPLRGLDKPGLLLPEYKQAAVDLAEKSCVLLKNDGVLPLKANARVALIGPYAENAMTSGMWTLNAKPDDTVTLCAGMKALFPETICAQGCVITEDASPYGDFGNPMMPKLEPELPPDADELLTEAKKTAQNADVVVLALGEHIFQSGEGGSRTSLTLNPPQMCLFDEITALGKPVVLVVYAGRPLILTDIADKVCAVLYAWYPGTMGGTAIANLLSGKTSPSGRLSMSFPRSTGQIPVYHSMLSTGRPQSGAGSNLRFLSRYQDSPNEPLYPFGYGLTYTTFAYEAIKPDGRTVTVTVKNTGSAKGTEVIQLYIRDKSGSMARPAKELKAFKRVELEPGESRQVTFEITDDMLKFYNQAMEYKAEAGVFEVMAGPNAGDAPLKTDFVLKAT